MNYKKFKAAIDAVFPTSRKLLVESSLKRMDFTSSNYVLIVGAGSDPYRNLFPHSCHYITMDICPVAGVTQVVADAHVLPFKKDSFDCVLASEVFEHLSDHVSSTCRSF